MEVNGGATPKETKNPEHYFWLSDEWEQKPGQVLPAVEREVLFGARVTPFNEERLVVSGGCEKDVRNKNLHFSVIIVLQSSCLFQNTDGISDMYEYHWRLGFRPLPAKLSASRYLL